MRHARPFLAAIALMLVLSACNFPLRAPTTPPPTPDPLAPAPTTSNGDLPSAVEYNLGDATITQERFPEDSRFRAMPVRLNGVIAAPTAGEGPFPVVVIFHGTHPGCPIPEGDMVDRWPCAPEVEQPNYRGFAYLVSELAAHGYIALSMNINAENTFGFGEGDPGERLRQIVDLQLEALQTANDGGDNPFGVDLAGRVDLERLALFGHSRGGESAYGLSEDLEFNPAGADIDPAHGPVDGILMIAPATVFIDPAPGSRAPFAILLPACDGDVITQDGQHYFEAGRLAPNQTAWMTSVWLEEANHNAFNTELGPDPFGVRARPDCETLLAPEVQQQFLVDYAVDFLTLLFATDPQTRFEATQRTGMATAMLAPNDLYGLPARTANLAAKSDRIPLFVPAAADEFETNGMGGEVVAEGLTTLFCPSGFYTPATAPGTEGCRRVNLEVPGQPAVAVLSWAEPGGSLRFKVPGGAGVFSILSALSMRAAIDPLSPLNPAGEAQAFSIRLTDANGNQATAVTRPDEPALQYPPGLFEEESFFEGGLFTGRVPLTNLRALLSQFPDVNLNAITEIALIFDQTPSGSLFFSDLELVRGPVEWRTTLSAPPTPELLAAAEAGDVEAQRQLANLYRPTTAMGIHFGSSEEAVYWYRQACAAGYANAQVDFFDFANSYDGPNAETYLAEATACLEDAIRQGHRMAIINGAFHAAFVNHDYKTGFFLYALFEGTEQDFADQRWSFAGNLTQAEIDEAELAAAEWRANHQIKDYDDFFIAVDSPFRVVSPTPAAAP